MHWTDLSNFSVTGALLAAVSALEEADSEFARFASGCLDRTRSCPETPPLTCSCCCHARRLSSGLFPCPLPRGGRVWTWVALLVAYSNWTSARSTCTCCWCWMSRPPSAAQLALLTRCDQLVDSFAGLVSEDCKLSGKRAGLHHQVQLLQADPYSSTSLMAAPRVLTSETASLPQCEHRVPLDDGHVHPVLARIFATPGIFDRPQSELPAQAPPSCSRVRAWRPLAGRMFDLGMLSLLPLDSTPRVGGVRAVSSLFGVEKKGSDALRVILDRRRRNIMERSLERVITEAHAAGELDDDLLLHLLRLSALPHPCQLGDLVLEPLDRIRLSSEDVAEFYHSLQWPAARWAENAVGALISYHIISCHVISYHTISYYIISYHIVSYHIISYHVSYRTSHHDIKSYHTVPYHIMISYYIIPYHIASCHIISCHMISCDIIRHHRPYPLGQRATCFIQARSVHTPRRCHPDNLPRSQQLA